VTVTGADGGHLALRDLRGRPVVMAFWATWCAPCRADLPLLAAVERAYRDAELAAVPVDYQESAEAVHDFARGAGIDLQLYLDADGAVARRFGVGLPQAGLPVTVLIDRDGTVVSVLLGQLQPDAFARRLKSDRRLTSGRRRRLS
jgi:thiol-disulfide isomerase/thioredoxin